MPSKQQHLLLSLLILSAMLSTGCDTTKTIYRSTGSKTDQLYINAVNLAHCGCTEIYANQVQNGHLRSQIFYNDKVLRKTIFTYPPNSNLPTTQTFIATTGDNYTIPFDAYDRTVIQAIQTSGFHFQGFSYPLQVSQYKGYIAYNVPAR